MKKLILLITISLSCLLSFAAKKTDDDDTASTKDAPRYTANYFKENNRGESFNGKSVTLHITSCKQSASSDKEGYTKFECDTYYDKTNGGTAIVYVADSKAKGFLKTYEEVVSSVSASSNKKKSSSKSTATKSKIVILNYEGGSIHYIAK